MIQNVLGSVCLVLGGLCTTPGQAATLQSEYQVLSAESERARRDVALSLFSGTVDAKNYWLTETVRGIFYMDGPGRMRETGAGTWEIVGRVLADDSAALGGPSGFELAFTYDDQFDFAPVFKSEAGSMLHGNEIYINMTGGILSGFGGLAGLDLSLSRMPVAGPYATQIGGGLRPELGANNHNANFGLANWFFVDEILASSCSICEDNDAISGLLGGDINVDLIPVAQVPLPAAGFLLAGALLTFRTVRRAEPRNP